MNIERETASAYRAFAAGRHTEAAERAKRILKQVPHDPAALTLLGRLALVTNEPDVARSIFERVLAQHSRNAALWLDLATSLRDIGRPNDAIDTVERAIVLDKDKPLAWVKLGELALSLNETDRASRAFRQALALDATSVAAYRGICQADALDVGHEVVARMHSLTSSSTLNPRETAELHYALAQVYRRAGRSDVFLHHLLAANASQRSLCADGRDDYADVFDRLEAAFTADTLAEAARADEVSPTPLFVLGMPRSGTTLIEQLLAAHPDVVSGGEIDYVRGPLRRAMEQLTRQRFPVRFETLSAAQLTTLARAFARRLELVGGGAKYVTDKTPGNFHVLGLLRVLFPAGKIVHVQRDPMDTCFSILQYPFDDRSPHTCDVDLLAYAYARYVRLMERWQEVCGGEFVTVQYERLVASPAIEGRRLFDHCGLEWSDAYLDFHRAGGHVRTFSAAQVRKPIYTGSVGAWREFASALEPLKRALARELPGYAPA